MSLNTKKLITKWHFESPIDVQLPKKPQTRDEEADEIVRRLSEPPHRNYLDLEGEILGLLFASITKEIDDDIIKSLKDNQCQK